MSPEARQFPEACGGCSDALRSSGLRLIWQLERQSDWP
jgi:hypothetical protein